MRNGIIFANTVAEGAAVKAILGLKYWLIITPRNYKTAARGVVCESRVLLVHDPASEPIFQLWLKTRNDILPMFTESPVIFRIERYS